MESSSSGRADDTLQNRLCQTVDIEIRFAVVFHWMRILSDTSAAKKCLCASCPALHTVKSTLSGPVNARTRSHVRHATPIQHRETPLQTKDVDQQSSFGAHRKIQLSRRKAPARRDTVNHRVTGFQKLYSFDRFLLGLVRSSNGFASSWQCGFDSLHVCGLALSSVSSSLGTALSFSSCCHVPCSCPCLGRCPCLCPCRRRREPH